MYNVTKKNYNITILHCYNVIKARTHDCNIMELHKTEFSQSESGKLVDCSIPNKLLQLYAYIFF